VEKVDKLTIIAHDSFQAIVDAANDPNSIIRRENIIEIDPNALPEDQTVVTSLSTLEAGVQEEKRQIGQITNEQEKQAAGINLEAKTALREAVMDLGDSVKNIGS